ADFVDAVYNLGVVLMAQGKLDEAIARFQHALALAPDKPDIRWVDALAHLLAGDFARGWEKYEWRWRRAAFPPRRFDAPAWDGSALSGRTILLHAEQGVGDTLQFIRYAPLVKA